MSIYNESYTVDYEPRYNGQITRYEAGIFYKAFKTGTVKFLPETIKMFYNETELSIRYASERYTQDNLFYSRTEKAVRAILNSDFETAQNEITAIEDSMIKNCGRKSSFYHYRAERGLEC